MSNEHKQDFGSVALESATILIVEDDDNVREIIKLSLAKSKGELLEAFDGRHAQVICNQKLPDLIICDIMMPVLDGIEFVKWFRESYPADYVPILMVTARDEIEEKVKGFAAGVDDYLTKPFHHKELQVRVNSLLKTKQLTQKLLQQAEELKLAYDNLAAMQQELLKRERQLVTMQLAGAAAHNLSQPITAVLLQCRVLEQRLKADGQSFADGVNPVLRAIKGECETMKDVLVRLEQADAEVTESYPGETTIIDVNR